MYQVPITSLESGAKFTVKAVRIPQIKIVYIQIGIDLVYMPLRTQVMLALITYACQYKTYLLIQRLEYRA